MSNMIVLDEDSLIGLNHDRRMRGQPLLHRCSVCGMCGEWDDSWSWFGSLLDEDAGTIAKFCSKECEHKENKESVLKRVRRYSESYRYHRDSFKKMINLVI